MLSSLASLPSGVASFVSNRRKTFTWVAGTVGGAYLLGQWGMKRIGDMAERARQESADKDNLARRFNLNQDDCQFTVLALLPTLAGQVLHEMDVEGCSAELAALAQRQKLKERKQAADEARKVEEQRKLAEEEQGANEVQSDEKVQVVPAEVENGTAVHAEEEQSAGAEAPLPPSASAEDPAEVPAAAVEEQEAQEPTSYAAAAAPPPTSPSLGTLSKLSAEAPAFSPQQPFVAPPPAPTEEPKEPAPSESTVLSRSWAQVVATGEDQAEEVGSQSIAALDEQPVVEETPSAPEKPERTRAELWDDIKILSFTRTITSLYLLTLLTLQTHVQLNLLGRASYVSSVLAALPPSPSPDPLTRDMNFDEDLELALYGAREEKDASQVGVSKRTEREYLTFSWWILHRGWKIVAERVKGAVEDVVGPMGLKSPVVYGELSTLFSQIRHKIDYDSDGTLYNFSSALFPPTPADELETLTSGGISHAHNHGPAVSAELRRLLNETSDALESADCTLVRTLCLDRMFAVLVGGMEAPFLSRMGGANEQQGSRFEDVTERTARLASLLPSVARQSRSVLEDAPNEYLLALEDVRELTEFSAILYSSFDRDNIRGSC